MVDLVEVMGGMGEYDVMYTGREWKYLMRFYGCGCERRGLYGYGRVRFRVEW